MRPDFLVIGAYKCGTTALHHYLRAHPQIFIPERKEPNYFAFADEKPPFRHPAARGSVVSLEEYEQLFSHASPGQKVGEVSPAYLAVPSALDRLHEMAPEARLIAILRNPIERAYSDYLMYRRRGEEHEVDFLKALKQLQSRNSAVDPTAHYLSTGYYFNQLSGYFKYFEHSQLLVILHEDLLEQREQVLRNVFSFIEVDPSVHIAEQVASNVSGVPEGLALRTAYKVRNRFKDQIRPFVPNSIKRRVDASLERRLTREPLPEDARAWLTELYRADINQLSELIRRDLSGWLD